MRRQGDILLVEEDKIPKNAKIKDNVLAYGEHSGHRHRVVGQAQVFIDEDNTQHVKVDGATKLVHEKHGVQDMPTKTFRMVHQRELTLSGEMREVVD